MVSGERIQKTWTELKTLRSDKSLEFNYEQLPDDSYKVYLSDNNMLWFSLVTGSDITDFENTYKTNSNKQTPVSIQITDGINPPAEVTASSGKWRLATDAIVTVEEIFGKDNFADTWFQITTPPVGSDTLTLTIENTGDPPYYQKVITFPSGLNTFGDEAADYIVGQLNADSNFVGEWWRAKRLNNIVFVISQKVAERGESTGLSPDAFTVETTGTLQVYKPAENGEIILRRKTTFLTPDPRDNRLGVLGVRGEVSTLQRANNPIYANVKKDEAALTFKKIFEYDGIEGYYAYFLQFALGTELGSEVEVYKGLERDRVETYSGDGTEFIYLDHQAVQVPTGYITSVTLNGSPFTAYTIIDNPDDPAKSILEKNSGTFAPTDTVVITYDAVERVMNLWAQKENSIVYPLPAPVRVAYEEFLIATYKNHSANAGTITFNTNGYTLPESEVLI